MARTGYDPDAARSRQAMQIGALDQAAKNLTTAVRDADFVILALPFDQVQSTLAAISNHLKEGAVVLDTAPFKAVVAAWAGELLPAGRYHIGLAAVINPAYLQDGDLSTDVAHADLFKNGLIGIVARPDAPEAALQLAVDLVHLLGAQHRFLDAHEADGLLARTHLLPGWVAAALLNATVDQAGWREASLLAGSDYAAATAPILAGEAGALVEASLANRENLIRALDGLIAQLEAVRAEFVNQDQESLSQRLARARQGRDAWWQSRLKPDPELPPAEMPAGGDFWKQLFGSRNHKRRP